MIVIVLLLAFGAGTSGWLYSIRVTPPRRDVGLPPPYVETIVVEPETVTERFLGYGVAEAERSARLSAELASTVTERINNIRVGTQVVSGQPLLRFDDREYRAALDRALALVAADEAALEELTVQATKLQPMIATAEEELRIAAAEFERVSGLFERELAAEKEMNVVKLTYQQTRRQLQNLQREAALIEPRQSALRSSKQGNQAAVEIARLNIKRCLVNAPFDGVIEELIVDVGDRVAPGTYLARVIDPSRVEIPIRLAGSLYDDVREGAPCDLIRESAPGVNWSGQVARIGPTIDTPSRTFAVYIVVDNRTQQRPLVPGTFLRAAVHGPTHVDAILVPRSAIRDDRVFIADNGVARVRRIRVRHYVEERAIVAGDLNPGDRVILTNLDILADGAPVRVAQAAAERSANNVGPIRPDARTAEHGPISGRSDSGSTTPQKARPAQNGAKP